LKTQNWPIRNSLCDKTEAKKLAKGLGCENFNKTSALTQHNLEDVLKGRKSKEKQAAKKAA